jgi:hypothetical protein
MLGTWQRQNDYELEMVSTRACAADVVDRIRTASAALVFIAALPGGLPQTRYLCTYLRKACPELPIVVGYWGNKEAFDKNLVRLRQAGASYLVTSLQQATSRIKTLSEDVAQRNLSEEVDGQMNDVQERITPQENNAENFAGRG